MFIIEVEDVFEVQGKGGMIAGRILNNSSILKVGDNLTSSEDGGVSIPVKQIELMNYEVGIQNIKHIGILTNVSVTSLKEHVGKRLYKK
ncbi:hypothetical protein MH215_07040 [Paenibacillus sp. ACRSA]|uniref:hypothetical protein n=1 Tax=Paenibacillus sp. ACRSA TaxID=2918211 RepID=UPI001EF42D29|nr:hypothetical protein [Paenibacillus sp. ACRSA]MCG7376744.1 hypothetical protein [Paenibacillus sp. ACRSA]